MADDFDPTNGAGDDGTPAFDLPNADGAPAAKAEPAEAPRSVEAELEREFDKLGTGDVDAKDAAKWSRELRGLSDATLKAYGVDPSQRDEAGISRREVVRRLFRADELLRSDPTNGFASLAAIYGDGLAAEQRAKIAGGVIQRLGFATPNAIAEQDAQRLRAYDAQAAEHRAAEARLRPVVARQVSDFAARNPDYEELRLVAASFVHTGAATTIERAFELARAASGRPSPQEVTAHAADAARRQKVASAMAASTPQTKSAPGQRRVDPNAPSRTVEQILSDSWDAMMGGSA